MNLSPGKNEHTTMISGLWFHRETRQDHRRRALEIWRKLFTARDMSGTTAECSGVAVLVGGQIHRLAFKTSPIEACSDPGLIGLLDMLTASGEGPSALLAGAVVNCSPEEEHVPPLVGDDVAIVHDGRPEVDRKPLRSQDKGPFGTGLLLSAASASLATTDPRNVLVRWRSALSNAKGCCTSAVMAASGDLLVCADAPNDIYLSIAPELSETVLISTLWEPLRDHAAGESRTHLGGFFRETVQHENLLGVVLRKGQLAHGKPGIDGESGRINWSGK